ncbi:uncharacterized protein [Physcomitrium patens]|uniref:DM2 domain-containing protein n=1 Tax=Physcomitrium patens TaxID=3218 RepID=A0A2K1JD91_PHYPA|nr:upstream activation factor subunit UAF30-like [Physcomitrium patens]PNR39489.1 hypothetical protein PHYPA_019767 [Physcomitrium patens]|eukprot:XP_024397000.1 upstream activation factor subunit UAF30-like [Physcomitrella patens]
MVSDAEIVRHLTAVLKKADLNTTTTTEIRQQLQSDLGVDLSDKKAFIRQQVDLYLQKQSQEQEEEAGGGGEGQGVNERGEEVGGGEQDVDDDNDDEDEEEGEEEHGDGSRESSKGSKTRGEPDSKRTRAKIDRAIKASVTKEKKKRTGGGGGLTKVCALSPLLQAIIGEAELPRTQVVKQLWAYIREHNLQDPDDKRKIICNDALRNLLGTNSTDMFKMNKLLSKHIFPLDNRSTGAAAKGRDRDTDTEDAEPKAKKQKADKSGGGKGKIVGFLAPCPISEQLAKFLDAEDGKVSRADAVKRLWIYIKENNLQDPSNKKMIVCDEQLQDLFDCDHFVGFDLTKLLTRHFIKPELQ